MSKERLQRQWKARERGFLKIFFQTYSQVNLEYTYQLPFLCTTETKLRVFEFKFLHRKIATNDFLLKIGKNWRNTLVFLLRWFPRGNTHLFWNFKSTQTFWNNVSQWTCEKSQSDEHPSYSYTSSSSSLDTISMEKKTGIYPSYATNLHSGSRNWRARGHCEIISQVLLFCTSFC